MLFLRWVRLERVWRYFLPNHGYLAWLGGQRTVPFAVRLSVPLPSLLERYCFVCVGCAEQGHTMWHAVYFALDVFVYHDTQSTSVRSHTDPYFSILSHLCP